MKSSEFIVEDESTKGTYAGLKFSDETNGLLREYCTENGVPNGLDESDFHTTLLYSKKYCPNYEPQGKLDTPWMATPTKLEIWESPANAFKDKATNCLILKYDCPEQVARFNELMEEHDASYDYDEYKTHVTLSYDVGEIDVDALPDVSNMAPLEIVEEYGEELNIDKTYPSDE